MPNPIRPSITFRLGARVRFKAIHGYTCTDWHGAIGTMRRLSRYGDNYVMLQMETGPAAGQETNANLDQIEFLDVPKGNILGWFPRKPGHLGAMDDEMSDVDWNPYD